MKTRGYLFLLGFAALLILIGIACSGGASATSQPIAQANSNANTNVNNNANSNSNSNAIANNNGNANSNSNTSAASNALVTFTDQNKYYQIDVPGNWKQTSKNGTHYYIDQFKSPDGNALVENIAYDDGTPFTGSQNGQFALQLLNQFYSSTGKEGDIVVSSDSIQKDGSERLIWTSKGGGYSGVSYFEIHNKTTFLMFTIEWMNDHKDAYLDTLNQVVSSYKVP